MTETEESTWEQYSLRMKNWVFEHRYFGWSLFLMISISLLFSEAFAVNELETQITTVSTLITDKIIPVALTAALGGGGFGAIYAGHIAVGISMIAVLILIGLGMGFISGGLKIGG